MQRFVFALVMTTVGVADAGEPKTSAAKVAPFVDDLTFLVARVDVPRVKYEDLMRRFEQILANKAPPDNDAFSKVQASFIKAGGKELFVLLNLRDGPNEPLGVIPIAVGSDKEALIELLKQGPNLQTEDKDGALIFGTPKAVAAAMKRQPKAIADLTKAFAAVETFSAQVVLLPPRPFFRAQEELAPDLPKELGGGPITVVSRGFQWAAVGADIHPKLEVKAVVQATDKAAAQELNQLVDRAMNGLSVQAKGVVPGLAALFPMLKPKVDGDQLVLALDEQAVLRILTPTVGQARAAAQRAQSTNNLKQIALALHSYHDQNKSFPPSATLSKQKKPLLSWRVHILPYVEGDALYREFKLDEPWDSEHNLKLVAKMPKVFASPLAANLPAGKTVYLGAAGADMIFAGPKGMTFPKITDGTSNTIMTVEVNDENAVTWTQPADYKPERKDPAAPLLRKGAKGFHVGMADGSVRMLTRDVSADLLWGMLTASGGEVLTEKSDPK